MNDRSYVRIKYKVRIKATQTISIAKKLEKRMKEFTKLHIRYINPKKWR